MALKRKKAKVGRRNSGDFTTLQNHGTGEGISSSEGWGSSLSIGSHLSDTLIRSDGERITIARPGLVVVAGYLYGAGVYEMLENAGIRTHSISVSWGREVLHLIDDGSLDLAIYNKLEVIEYLKKNTNSSVRIVGDVGTSMGGKNFSITVAANSDLVGIPLSDLPANLTERQFYVGKNTDRYRNILTAFKMTEDEFLSTGVEIVDIPDPPLSIIKNNPMALLACGQNMRLAAQMDDSFIEILNYDLIDPEDQSHFNEASKNCLIVSRRMLNMFRIPSIELMKYFAGRLCELQFNQERLDNLIKDLTLSCFTSAEQEEFDCGKLARQIMFETYRVGSRQW